MKLEKRQKVILGLVVIALLILIWQLYVIFGGGVSSESSTANASSTNTSLASGTKTVTVSTLKEVTSPTNVMQPVSAAPATSQNANAAAAQAVTPTQQKYLALVSQYQLVEIQRLIAQDQAAIAAARAATASSLSKISESGGDVNNLMTNIVTDTQAGDYELIYTGQDNGEWTATLKRNGQFNDVTAGTVLPNGDKVLSVDDSGVLVQEGNTKKLVTFNGVSPVTNQLPASQETNSAANLDNQFQKSPISDVNKSVSKSEVKKTEVKTEAALPSPVADEAKPVNSVNTSSPASITTQVPVTPSVPAAKKPVVLPKVVATNAKPAESQTSQTSQTPKVSMNKIDIETANKKAYTIQVVSEGNLGAVKEFVSENRLSGRAQIVKVQRNNKPWYIVVVGEYSSMAAAQKGVRQLSDRIQNEGPFVRRIGDVQSEMAD